MVAKLKKLTVKRPIHSLLLCWLGNVPYVVALLSLGAFVFSIYTNYVSHLCRHGASSSSPLKDAPTPTFGPSSNFSQVFGTLAHTLKSRDRKSLRDTPPPMETWLLDDESAKTADGYGANVIPLTSSTKSTFRKQLVFLNRMKQRLT